jgi:L-seryl-tRNA(Ser) seleniumtransferase
MRRDNPSNQLTRRGLFRTGLGAALGGLLGGGTAPAAKEAGKANVYQALGLKPVINCQGTVTVLGGSVMPPEVVAAWVEASKHFVNLPDLIDKVGDRIAQLIGVEAATVTTGASGSLFLATVAAVTRGNREFARRLPDTTGMRNEVIIQKTHHTGWDMQLQAAGIKFKDVQTAEDVERAVGERTALMFFMNIAEPQGKIKREEWLELARKHRVPTLLDAAADVPPVERLSAYIKMGFDMVAFSGGKAIRGPNDTGLLLGRRDLIDTAKANASPHAGIGRHLKVSKEDLIACLAAVERFVKLDHEAEWKEWERRVALIRDRLRDIPTVEGQQTVPPIANHVPHLQLTWDPNRVKITSQQVARELAAGDPPIVVGGGGGRRGAGLTLSVFTLQEGQDRVVADRLHAVLRKALA